MPEPTQEPSEGVSTIGFWDANLRTAAGLMGEVRQEYVSKDRLRVIAVMALAQLTAMFTGLKEQEIADAAAAQPADSGLLVPDHRIITLE